MTITVLKAQDQGQLLTAMTALLGYTPTESLVITPFRGNRTQGAMRIDLPPVGEAGVTAAYAAQALGLVCRLEGVTGIAAAIYTNGDEALHAPLAADLSAVCSMIGLDVAALLYSTPNAWGEYFGEAHTGPAPAVDNAPALAAGDQHAGIELPETDAALAAAVAAATFPTDDDATVTALLEDVLALDVAAAEPSTLAHLAAVMVIPALRDAALIQWASDERTGREAVAAQTAWTVEGTPLPEHIFRIYVGKAERPDPERLEAALAACLFTAAHVTGHEHAALLAAAAWLSWALGRSTRASHYLEHAGQADPDLTIVETFRPALAAGMLPAWAFTR
ncbi:DUF4192 family protein [Microbacterium algeriense]|uniref:DUF4192 family protein n=1 Tax=Microbacterium algeriense TaxID=2615184 RepID=UPI0022E901FD|nr:DUF4192 family protein [Microbacterium algeriense]